MLETSTHVIGKKNKKKHGTSSIYRRESLHQSYSSAMWPDLLYILRMNILYKSPFEPFWMFCDWTFRTQDSLCLMNVLFLISVLGALWAIWPFFLNGRFVTEHFVTGLLVTI